MTRRDVLRFAMPLLAGRSTLLAAPCQSSLDQRTIDDYEAYLKTVRPAMEQPFSKLLSRVAEDQRPAALQDLEKNHRFVWNLKQSEPNGAVHVFKGVIVDWMGAILLPGVTLSAFENVLQQYDAYKRVYKPYIFECYAHPISGPGYKNYAVTSILHDVLEKPAPLVPDQHFSFEVAAESNYFKMGPEENRTLVIRTHAKSIREADGGRPERADGRVQNSLLPAGRGQGVLWKSDTWWRATQVGSSLYAEYESVSLARSLDAVEVFSLCSVLKLPGVKGKALESITVRPQKTVTSIVLSTKKACESAAQS